MTELLERAIAKVKAYRISSTRLPQPRPLTRLRMVLTEEPLLRAKLTWCPRRFYRLALVGVSSSLLTPDRNLLKQNAIGF
jgi:hypothetical protein